MYAQMALLLLSALPAESVPQGTWLTYRGKFVASQGEPGAPEKDFDVSYVLASSESDVSLYWLTDERGRGGWSWLDRFGRISLNEQLRAGDGQLPTLLDHRPAGTDSVPLLLPLLTYGEPLSEGISWLENRLEHAVVGKERVSGKPAWRIDVRGPIGLKRSIWVDQESPVVLAVREIVFLGQGEQHELRFELVSRAVLENEGTTATVGAFQEFLRLRERLGAVPQTREFAWTDERLALLKSDLPLAKERAQGTPLAKLAQSAEQESRVQKDRQNALGALQGKLVGQPSPQPALVTLTGTSFAWSDLKDKVTILHFWEYRDEPLEEPYGQVAYLDFLFRKHAGGDVRMFGVVSDDRISQPETRRGGIQSARRLHTFMNLSYPLLVAESAAVKQFGDPRVTGAKLPLFVVIDRSGKIVHYHVGHYEVNRDRGLEELEQVVRRALESRG